MDVDEYIIFDSICTDVLEQNKKPFSILNVTDTTITGNVEAMTHLSITSNIFKSPYVGLLASQTNYKTGILISTNCDTMTVTDCVANTYTSGTPLICPLDKTIEYEGGNYLFDYQVTLNSSKSINNSPVIPNSKYYVFSFALPSGTNLFSSGTFNLVDVYTQYNDVLHLWNYDTGNYYEQAQGNGLDVVTLPSAISSVTLNDLDLSNFKRLKPNQIGSISYTSTISTDNGSYVSYGNFAQYARYKYSTDTTWSSWQKTSDYFSSQDSLKAGAINSGSINIQCKRGETLQIEFSYGSLLDEYSQQYYSSNSFLSPAFSMTINIPAYEEKADFETLKVPEYRIEIWKSRLSDEANYQFLEYIEANGTQYIDTGYEIYLDTRIVTTASFSDTTHDMVLLGAYDSTTSFYKLSYNQYNVSKPIVSFSANTERTPVEAGVLNEKTLFDITYDKLLVNNKQVQGKTGTTSPSSTLYLFGLNNNGTFEKPFYGRIYSCAIYEGSELIAMFRPAIRKTDNYVGMYDTIHKVFYENAGTGTFAAGQHSVGSDFGMIVDISNIAISDMTLTKERNIPDALSIDIEYTQFKEKLAKEKTDITNVIKPYLVDIVVKRNFKIIFSGILMYSKVSLQAVGKQTLTLQAMGYGEELNKRYISCSYGDMSYPEIARQIIYDSQHEMNWIDNYDFLANDTDSADANDTSYFNGWGAIDTNYVSYIPIKAKNTDYYLAHWQNGGIPFAAGCVLQCFKLTCSQLNGTSRWGKSKTQYLYVEFWHCAVGSGPKNITVTMTIESNGTDDSTNTSHTDFSFVTQSTNSSTSGNVWRKYSAIINIGTIQGLVKHISFKNASSNDFYINDFNIYRPSLESLRKKEANIAATTAYDLNLKIGYFDSAFSNTTNYSRDRVRHYHQQNAKEALYNLSKLEDQNFEYYVDEYGKYKLYEAQGDLVVKNVATYPGELTEIEIERDANSLYNVGYAVNTHLYDNSDLQTFAGQSFVWTDLTNGCAINEDSCKTYKARAQIVQCDTTTRKEIDSEALGAINTSDEVQNIPTLKFDSNTYNPGNVSIGDAFGINVNIDDNFNFINGEYRVYSYNLRLSTNHVESMDITVVAPTALQLQLMTFPVTMKNMMKNIKRLQIKSNK